MDIKPLSLPMDIKGYEDKVKNLQGSNKSVQVSNLAEAENVAKEFETLFMDMMVKSMRVTAKPEEETPAMDIFQGMLDSEYAKSMTAQQSFGLREMVVNWLKQNDPTLQTKNETAPELQSLQNTTSKN